VLNILMQIFVVCLPCKYRIWSFNELGSRAKGPAGLMRGGPKVCIGGAGKVRDSTKYF